MIAYHILCHDNLAQVAALVEALQSPDEHFLIDIDDGKRPDERALRHVAKLPNVRIKRDAGIGWGGGGTMRKTLLGAFELLDMGSWRYYVVLSGQDLPLKSNDVIRARLARGDAGGISYLRAHLAKPVALADLPIDNPSSECRMWGDRGHTKVWARPGTIDPQADMYARRLVDVAEVGERGEVFVGLCDPLLARFRDDFFARHPFHVGANWFNLHRSLVEHMRTDPFAYELYDVMRTTFIPDESYFQTYVKGSPFRDRVDPDHGRLILRPGPVPRVKVFDRGDAPTLRAATELFGRKFDTRVDESIVREVLEARAA